MPGGGPVGQGSIGSVLEIGTSCHEMSEPYLFTDDCFFLTIHIQYPFIVVDAILAATAAKVGLGLRATKM